VLAKRIELDLSGFMIMLLEQNQACREDKHVVWVLVACIRLTRYRSVCVSLSPTGCLYYYHYI